MIQKYPRATGRTTLAMMEMFMFALHNESVKCVYITHNHSFAQNCADKMWKVVFDLGVGRRSSNSIILVNGSSMEFKADEVPINRGEWQLGRELDWVSYDHII